MDETIDLRPYVDALIRRWWVILGAAIGGVLIAAFLYFSSSQYRATALVAAIDPTQRLQFDQRIVNTVDLDAFSSAYPELATSDDLLSVVLAEAEQLTDGAIATLSELRAILNVDTGSDSRLLRLSVRHEDPQTAAELANVWATAFVRAVDTIYFGHSGQIEFYDQLWTDTNAEIAEVEQALVDFQSGSRMGIVDNQLASLNEQQGTYLADQRRLNLLLDDIRALRAQIEAGDGETITFADQLTALTLQQKVYVHETPIISPTIGIRQSSYDSIQLQTSPQFDLTTSVRSEQLALLDDLAQTAEASLESIDVKLLELETRFFALQREKQAIAHQYDELTRKRDVAVATSLTLARKIDEVRVQSQDSGSSLRIASLAAPPIDVERSNLITTAGIAAVVGLLISAAAILLLTWWKSTANRSTS